MPWVRFFYKIKYMVLIFFFTLGTVSIVYVVTFVVIKAAGWGINANFVDAKSKSYVAGRL